MTGETKSGLEPLFAEPFAAQLAQLRQLLAARPETWQHRLHSPPDLASRCRDFGVAGANEGVVMGLWRLGLLRADVVTSESALEIDGLIEAHAAPGIFSYCDLRRPPAAETKLSGALDTAREPDGLALAFHPFRAYVVHRIASLLELRTSPFQFLVDPNGVLRIANHYVDDLARWCASPAVRARIEAWNWFAEIAVVAEPPSFRRIFHMIRASMGMTFEEIEELLARHSDRLDVLFKTVSSSEVQQLCHELVCRAQDVDANKRIHTLLRLISAQERERLKGRMGLAMLILTMAESVRRAAEHALHVELPEEDEAGYGTWMDGAREQLYGTRRVFDADDHALRELLGHIGLRVGIRARLYVEGETEWGAYAAAISSTAGIEHVNLRGQTAQKSGNALSFVDSVKSDQQHGIFSVAVVDGDRADTVKALRRATADGHFFGRFWISEPDFEFANFTSAELVEIAGEHLQKQDLVLSDAAKTAALVATSGKQLEAALAIDHVPGLKGADWGAELMAHALRHPHFPGGHTRAGSLRPMLETVGLLEQALRVGYMDSVRYMRTDHMTGELVKRTSGA